MNDLIYLLWSTYMEHTHQGFTNSSKVHMGLCKNERGFDNIRVGEYVEIVLMSCENTSKNIGYLSKDYEYII